MRHGILLTALTTTVALTSCSKAEVDSSYCEALCEWATTCAESERDVGANLYSDCLAAAEAVDSSCTEELNAADAKLLEPCVNAIDEKITAGECGAFTGSIDDQKLGTTPASCAGQGTDAQAVFDAVQDSTAESGDELCERFSYTFCERLEECVVSDYITGDSYDILVDALGGKTPTEVCYETAAIAGQTQSCKDEGLYDYSEELVDANSARELARTCLTQLGELSCSDLFSGNMPEVCVGSFTSAEDALTYAEALYGLLGGWMEIAGL